MSQDVYDNPIRSKVEAYKNNLELHYNNSKDIMASKRKQMTSKVREVLERYIAPDGWKTLNVRTNDEEYHAIYNNGTIIYLEDIEKLTEEIVNIKLGSNGKR